MYINDFLFIFIYETLLIEKLWKKEFVTKNVVNITFTFCDVTSKIESAAKNTSCDLIFYTDNVDAIIY